ncbi:hypothetical protein ACF09J_25715 [Streptomyces sp. NPDC014889]|uniref:hypothetical protein n=1 Tax=Streptomyces sp. NPDC014889 TaxID=3364928 RepID=UPI0036F8191B
MCEVHAPGEPVTAVDGASPSKCSSGAPPAAGRAGAAEFAARLPVDVRRPGFTAPLASAVTEDAPEGRSWLLTSVRSARAVRP